MQVNIDFESEQDMVEKARIGLALQPVATALFANSPFRDGKPTGQPALTNAAPLHYKQYSLLQKATALFCAVSASFVFTSGTSGWPQVT